MAVRRGHTKLVEFFLKKIKESDKEKIKDSSSYIARRKWEEKIDVDEQKNDDGMTAVFIAIKEKNLPILKILRKYGADFNQ